MAEDVNNESPPSKLDERKIVVEFCQLQEKSRQLFNALRYFSFSDVFPVVYHPQASCQSAWRACIQMHIYGINRLFLQPSFLCFPLRSWYRISLFYNKHFVLYIVNGFSIKRSLLRFLFEFGTGHSTFVLENKRFICICGVGEGFALINYWFAVRKDVLQTLCCLSCA